MNARLLVAVILLSTLILAACGSADNASTVSAAPSKLDKVDSTRAPVFDAAFWSTWADGQAELSGYDLMVPKYKAPRKGVAVAIFVTETFSNTERVKADPGKHPPADEFPVMKLNLVKDFQTGIYDYNEMVSGFVALQSVNGRPAGSLAKASFSSQEWCGHVYSQLLFDDKGVRLTSHSYFDGEGDQQRQLEYPGAGLGEDALWLWARGMAQPALKPGDSVTAPMLMSLAVARDRHQPVTWKPVTLARSANARKIRVPAGEFQVEEYTADTAWGKRTFLVETAAPRRVIEYETSEGEKASLVKSARLKYWQMSQPGGESALRQLGLAPRPPRTN